MKRSAWWLACMACGVSVVVQAADSDDFLFGDWHGQRSALAAKGIDLNLGYTSEDVDNLRGGDRHDAVHTGQLTLGAHADLQKLWGIPGAELQLTITYRDGQAISQNGVDTLLQPQEVYGRDQTWRLTELWWGQKLWDDRFQFKLGRLTVGGEFGALECSFLNQGLCGTEPGNINGSYWYNWPISQWALVGQWNVDASHYVKLGAYQVNPGFLDRDHQFTLNPGGTIGTLFPIELGWTPRMAGTLPGTYKLGAWYTNAREPDIYMGTDGGAAALGNLDYRMRDGEYGAYFSFEQQLTHGDGAAAKSGLRLFVDGTYSDPRTSTITQTLAVGGIYQGLFAARPADQLGIGVSALHANPRETANEAILYARHESATPPQTAEDALEVFYAVQIAPWLAIQPEVQWIHHPGNIAVNQGNYTIVGIKTSATF